MAIGDNISPALAEASGVSIASHVSTCLLSFEEFHNLVGSPENQFSGQLESSEVTDELGRFRIWAGNIGAHRKGRSSLDYRLRDASHIKKKVQTLLDDLKGLTNRALQIIRGERVPWDKRKPEPDSDSDVTDSESEDGSFQGETELRQLLISVHDTITFLLRLSIAIRNPAPHDQYTNSANIDTSHFEGFDIKHVREKFPKVSEEVAVILGKAISRRREYFRYRESHSKKLSDGIATEVVHRPGQIAAPEINQESKTEIVPQSTVASSIPRELKAENAFLDLEEDQHSESGFTQTSFATSIGGNQELKVPSMPKGARNGNPFPCPLCFMIISVGSRRSWKKHVFQDLHPYTCTFSSCPTPHRLFERRHEWFQHELQNHRRIWDCKEGCQAQFESQTDFELHIKGTHPHFDQLQHLVSVCERKPSMDTKSHCSFCDRNDIRIEDLEKHLGKHQEQLALFALPRIPGEGAEDAHDSDAEIAGSKGENDSVLGRLSNGSTDDVSLSQAGSGIEIPEGQRRGPGEFLAPNSCPHFQSGCYIGSSRKCTTCHGLICNDCLNSGSTCVCAYCSTHYHCWVCFYTPEVQFRCLLAEESKLGRLNEAVGGEITFNDKITPAEFSQQPELKASPRSKSSVGLDENSTQTNLLHTAPVNPSTPMGVATTDNVLYRRTSVSSSTTAEEDDAADDGFDTGGSLRPAVPAIIEWLGAGEKVFVTGTFTQWKRKLRLHKNGPSKHRDAFSATVHLQPGTHHLMFIVDKEMRLSPELPTAIDFANNLVNYLEVSPDNVPQELHPQPTIPIDIPGPPHQEDEKSEIHISPDVYSPQNLFSSLEFQKIPQGNPSASGTPAPATSPEPTPTLTTAGTSSHEVPCMGGTRPSSIFFVDDTREVPYKGRGLPYGVFVVEDADDRSHHHRFPMHLRRLPDVDWFRRTCHYRQRVAEKLAEEAQLQFLDRYLEREFGTNMSHSTAESAKLVVDVLVECDFPEPLVNTAMNKHTRRYMEAPQMDGGAQDLATSANDKTEAAAWPEAESSSGGRKSTGPFATSFANLEAGDSGSTNTTQRHEEKARDRAGDEKNLNPEPEGHNSSSAGPHRRQRAQTFSVDTSVTKRYIVTRKHPMSLISSSTSVLVFKDEYLDIVPSKTANSDEPSIQNTISAHFSEVVGSKVRLTRPTSFKVVIYRGQGSKTYDFEANSAVEAADIVRMISDSIERCQDKSQRAVNNIEAEIVMTAGEAEE